MIRKLIKEKLNHQKKLFTFFSKVYNITHFNKNRGSSKVKLSVKGNFLSHCVIKSFGKGNSLYIEDFGNTKCMNLSICIYGSNNSIYIGKNCLLNHVTLWMEDDDNSIVIKDNSQLTGKAQLATIEGTKIHIGNDCLFSSNIALRTGDSHSILSNETHERINSSQDILIGNHVWLGANTSILKGVTIGNNSVVGMGALVSSPFKEENVILAGVPAKVIKTDINWDINRIPF